MPPTKWGRLLLAVSALGVVFGDIGTSPLYTLSECFKGAHGVGVSHDTVVGSVSLVIWFLIIVVSVKYAALVMQADNRGEGGELSLMALAHRIGTPKMRTSAIIPLLGMLGASLLISDGMITPAISVLSAVEGLSVASPNFAPFVVPLALVIIIGLFAVQSRGTAKVGNLFGPIILLWFVVLTVMGFLSILHYPAILAAFNPIAAIKMLMHNGLQGFFLLGTAILAVTGAEVLFADMGHFGKKPIRMAWYGIVFPALIINYLGQGAQILSLGGLPANLFYSLVPAKLLIPMVILSTVATVIASQAVITGAFSITKQAVQLGLWPRVKVVHTSSSHSGQIFIPFMNLFLCVAIIILILSFRHSTNLASAYGIAVAASMLITTTLVLMLAPMLWPKVPKPLIYTVGAFFILFDGSLVIANLAKLLTGGWIVALIATSICFMMTTWVACRKILGKQAVADAMPVSLLAMDLKNGGGAHRADRVGIFLSGNAEIVPRALLHNLKHNGVLHKWTLLVAVQTVETPFVEKSDRCTVTDHGEGLYAITLKFGFMETPDVVATLAAAPVNAPLTDPMRVSYFLGKESLVITRKHPPSFFKKQVFFFLSRNALPASSFFNLPANRVVELGTQVEL